MTTIIVRANWEPRKVGELMFRVVLPDGNGKNVFADYYPKIGDEIGGVISGYTVYHADKFTQDRIPCVLVH